MDFQQSDFSRVTREIGGDLQSTNNAKQFSSRVQMIGADFALNNSAVMPLRPTKEPPNYPGLLPQKVLHPVVMAQS